MGKPAPAPSRKVSVITLNMRDDCTFWYKDSNGVVIIVANEDVMSMGILDPHFIDLVSGNGSVVRFVRDSMNVYLGANKSYLYFENEEAIIETIMNSDVHLYKNKWTMGEQP